MEHKKLVEGWLHDMGIAVGHQVVEMGRKGKDPRKKGGSEMDGGWIELEWEGGGEKFQVHVQIWQGVDHYRASIRLVVPDK